MRDSNRETETETETAFDAPINAFDAADTFTAFQDVMKDVQNGLVDRTSAVYAAMVALTAGEHMVFLGPPGCLSGETKLRYKRGARNGGRSITLKRLYEKFNGLPLSGDKRGRVWQDEHATYLQSYDHATGRVFYNQVISVLSSGEKPCRTLTLSGGRRVTLTADHPVLTPDGFVEAGGLECGGVVVCCGSMKPTKGNGKAPKKERIVVTVLKYYASGWDGSIKNTGKTYNYRRQHRSRLVVEAAMNHMTYDAYLFELKNNPEAVSLRVLPKAFDVHHGNGDTMDDRLQNLQVLPHADHPNEHDPVENFKVEHVCNATVRANEDAGVCETYDIQMAAPANNFSIVNGPIVHNTAKSLLVRDITERVIGATYFERLLSRFSEPNEVFGPYNLAAMEQGRYERVKAGSLLEAHIAFLDECFKANSSILNSLLTILNERVYHEMGQAIQAPLLSLFGASNETPEEEELKALDDRFLMRLEVVGLSDDAELAALLTLDRKALQATITLEQITQAQSEAAAIQLTPACIQTLISIKRALEAEKIPISDRRFRGWANLVRAAAWLQGDLEADTEHCEVVRYSAWYKVTDRKTAEKSVMKLANKLGFDAIASEDAARDLFASRPVVGTHGYTDAIAAVNSKLSDTFNQLAAKMLSGIATPGKRRAWVLASTGARVTLDAAIAVARERNGHGFLRAEESLDRIDGWRVQVAKENAAATRSI